MYRYKIYIYMCVCVCVCLIVCEIMKKTTLPTNIVMVF